ncbi:MAG: metallophosphoesterase [Acetobacterales bacterium]
MPPFRLVQVSDTHISRLRAYFHTNWEAFLELMAEEKPDLIVHSGDLCLRGNVDEDDMLFGRAQLDRMPAPVAIIPGNHDIGDTPPDAKRGHPVTQELRDRWVGLFGPDRWSRDAGGWTIIGLNAQIFDSGLPCEAEQWEWLEDALARASGRPVLVFCHKNLFAARPDEPERSAAVLYPDSRHRLLDLFGRHDVRAVASGHNHVYRTLRHGGMELIWAPGTSFVHQLEKKGMEDGIRRSGYLRYTLDADRMTHEFVEPPLLFTHDLTNWSRAHGTTVHLPERPLHGMGG